jgi:O-acetyl-ADP-ribose deacetylase (regulator of RNase III)
MKITIVSLNKTYCELSKNTYDTHIKNIEDYIPEKKYVFYVSPANSLGFMDGGIDIVYSRIMFPDIEKSVKSEIKKLNILSKLGRPYLPIGRSLIVPTEKNMTYLVVSPTMHLPHNVQHTNNCYHATMSSLKIINEFCESNNINDFEVIFTSMCCGHGCMSENESFKQFNKGVNDFKNYNYDDCKNTIMSEQPCIYDNLEFCDFTGEDIIS